jgi:hypothetical protein
MAPQYIPNTQYTSAPSSNLAAPHQNVQHNPFGYNPYAGGNINVLVPVPAFANNYIQQRPLPRLEQPDADENRGRSYARNDRHGYVEELHSQSPPIKSEPHWNPPTSSPSYNSNNTKNISPITPTNGSNEITFKTEVDTLMKAIQTKSQSSQPQKSSSMEQSRPVVGASSTPPYNQGNSQAVVHAHVPEGKFKLTYEGLQDGVGRSKDDKKRYVCTIEDCSKSFYQKTHLDIHERSHTGDKPYVSESYRFDIHTLTTFVRHVHNLVVTEPSPSLAT